MSKTYFPRFHATFPAAAERVPYDAERYDALAARVPEAVANEWRNFGFCAYGDGLLWTVVPDEPLLSPDDWRAIDGTGVEVLRTGFGDVCLWQGQQFLWQNIHTGNAFQFPPNPEILFEVTVIETHFRKSVLYEPLFKVGRRRYGELNSEECYGFAPLPALGGAIAEEYLIKTRLREYLAMSAQALS